MNNVALAVATVAGVSFMGHHQNMKELGIDYKFCKNPPELDKTHVIEMEVGGHRVQLYPMNAEAVSKLGVFLSRHLKTEVGYKRNGLWVKAWNHGIRVDPQYGTLSVAKDASGDERWY